jgi:hypothetical protein
LRRGSHHHHCHEEVRKEGRIPCACAAQTETALFFIKASAAKTEILVGLKSEFLPGDRHGRRRRRRRRVMRVWQRGGFCERGFLLFIGICCFSFTRRGDFEEEEDEAKSSEDRRANNACRKNGFHKEDCCNKLFVLLWRERERFKNSHHENQSPNSTLFFHFFSVFHGFRDLIHSCCLTDIGTYSLCLIIFLLKNTSKIC